MSAVAVKSQSFMKKAFHFETVKGWVEFEIAHLAVTVIEQAGYY